MPKNSFPPSRSSKKKILQQFGTHIFYAEGKKTEPLYVEDMKELLKERYRMSSSDIIIVDDKSGGRNTLWLVSYAERDVAERIRVGQKIDHAWIFYDKDSFDKGNFDNAFHKVISKNKEKYINIENDYCDENGTRWHALWSNECFELWVLLHFQYCDSALSRKQYESKINDNLIKQDKDLSYEKNLTNLFQLLENFGSIKNAFQWARKLNDELSNPNIKTNPSTGIYELLEYFHAYLGIEL